MESEAEDNHREGLWDNYSRFGMPTVGASRSR